MPLFNPSSGAAASSIYNSTAKRQKLLAPFDPINIVNGGTNLSNFILGCRVEAPISGTLHDLSIFVRVAGGNVRVGVYDTGEASAGNRSLLYGSGSVVAAGTDVFQVIGDPNIAVTAGQTYDLVVFPDTNTLSLGRIAQVAAGNNALPTSFIPTTGGASPKLSWAFNLAFAALPATITEANCGASGAVYWVGGRIS